MNRAVRPYLLRTTLAVPLLSMWAVFMLPVNAVAQPVTLQFQVRADPLAAAPRCEASAADTCRDDLDLTQVFDVLRRMAAGSSGSPFKRLAAGTAVAGVEVTLGAGTYRLRSELLLSGWSGSDRYGPLLVKGSGADSSVITGTVAVPASAWRPVPQGETRLTAAARPNVRMAPLSALNLVLPPANDGARPVTGFGEPVIPVLLDVFSAGRPLPLARWPNLGWARVDAPSAAAAAAAYTANPVINTATPPARTVLLRNGHFAAWAAEPALVAAGYFSHDWAFERIPVSGVNLAETQLLLQGAGAKFGVRPGQRVVVENALVELDSPGEWYVDRARGVLYLWPPEPAATIEVAVAPGLLHIEQSSNVTVRDIGFEGSTGDAVRILQSRNVTLADAVVRNVGNRAVVIDGGSTVALRHVVMTDLGDGGISVSGGDRRRLAPAGHVIEACRIERFARLSRSYRPAIAVEGVGIQLLRNRIADGPHSAIVFGGNDHRIEGNHISDVVTETNDAGALYTGRDWTTRGTVITNNLLQNIYPRLPGAVSVMGIYLDDQASGTTISGNVFANVSRAVFIGGGRDVVVESNVFVASSPAVFADNRGTTWQRDMVQDPNGHLRRSLRNMPVTSDTYRSRYPQLAGLLDDEPGRSKYNRATNNLFVVSRDFEFLDGAQTGLEQSGNRALPWSAFKTLRGPKASYTPNDFELLESAVPPAQLAKLFRRDGIPP